MAPTRPLLIRRTATALAGLSLLFGAVSCNESGASDDNADKKNAEKKEQASNSPKPEKSKDPEGEQPKEGNPIPEKGKGEQPVTAEKEGPKPVGRPVKIPGAETPKEEVTKKDPKNEAGKPKKPWGNDHMELATELIGLLDRSATVLESAVDPLTAKAAAEKFDKLTTEVVALMKHMQKVGPPKGETKANIIKKVGAFQRKLDVRLQTSLTKIGKNREMGQHIGPVWVRMAEKSEEYQDVAVSWGLR